MKNLTRLERGCLIDRPIVVIGIGVTNDMLINIADYKVSDLTPSFQQLGFMYWLETRGKV